MTLTRYVRAMAVVIFTCLFCPPPLTADPPPPESHSSGTAVPDYLKKWEFGIDVNEDRGPRFLIDTIIPLYR